jgi:hypothetical protein
MKYRTQTYPVFSIEQGIILSEVGGLRKKTTDDRNSIQLVVVLFARR